MTKISKILTTLLLLAFPLSAAPSSAEVTTITLSETNTLVLNSIVNGDSVGQLLVQAGELDKKSSGLVATIKHTLRGNKPEPMYLFLNTPGGIVQSGLELVEGLKSMRRPVHTVTAFAASMGFQIAQSLGTRYVLKSGILMSHYAVGEFAGAFGGQEPSQAMNRYRIWSQRIKEMDEQTVLRTNGKQTLQSYQKAYNTELWVTGSEAVTQGYADEVVRIKCDDSLSGVTTNVIVFFGIPIAYDLAKCPINSSPMNIRIGLVTNKGRMTLDEFRSKKGSFGALCLQEAVIDQTRVCSLDTSLSYEKLDKVKAQFVDTFENKRDHVVPMTL